MHVKVYWINQIDSGRIGIIPRPRGGDWLVDEISSLRQSHVDILISLLEEQEILELDLEHEQLLCEKTGLIFLHFPIVDRSIPKSHQDTKIFLTHVSRLLSEGKNVVIHCRQGVGRSATIAALLTAMNGISIEEAFEQIRLARGCEVPDTTEQRQWAIRFAEGF